MTEENYNIDEDDDENLESQDYSKKSDFSKAKIVDDQIRKVGELRSQEMKEGYYNYTTTVNGDVLKTYIPDSRKAYVGGVEELKIILSPEIKSDLDTLKFLEEFKIKKQEIFNRYSVNKMIVVGQEVKVLPEKYIPEMDDLTPFKVINRTSDGCSTSSIKYLPGQFNYNVRQYWNAMVELYDSLFEKLNLLVASSKVNYFKQKSGY